MEVDHMSSAARGSFNYVAIECRKPCYADFLVIRPGTFCQISLFRCRVHIAIWLNQPSESGFSEIKRTVLLTSDWMLTFNGFNNLRLLLKCCEVSLKQQLFVGNHRAQRTEPFENYSPKFCFQIQSRKSLSLEPHEKFLRDHRTPHMKNIISHDGILMVFQKYSITNRVYRFTESMVVRFFLRLRNLNALGKIVLQRNHNKGIAWLDDKHFFLTIIDSVTRTLHSSYLNTSRILIRHTIQYNNLSVEDVEISVVTLHIFAII